MARSLWGVLCPLILLVACAAPAAPISAPTAVAMSTPVPSATPTAAPPTTTTSPTATMAPSPSPSPTVTSSPSPQPTATPPPPTATATATSTATLGPTPEMVLPADEAYYQGWVEHRDTTFGFSFYHPADWVLAESKSHWVRFRQPDNAATLTVAYRFADEQYGIQRTGVGSGDLVHFGTVAFLGQPVDRVLLVFEGQHLGVMYNGSREMPRGGLVFTVALDWAGQWQAKPAITPEQEAVADLMVASFRLLDAPQTAADRRDESRRTTGNPRLIGGITFRRTTPAVLLRAWPRLPWPV